MSHRKQLPQKREEPKIQINVTPNAYNHWKLLHEYAFKNKDTWNVEKAEKFVKSWIGSIPNRNCNCWEDFQPILRKLPIETTTPRNFQMRAWQWHDKVSEKLGKSRITWADALGSYWHAVEKKRPNALVCVATGRCLKELDIIRPSLQYYADKVNADLICLVNDTEPWWGYEKFRVQQISPHYNRTLFVDSDVIITPSCPDLFKLVPKTHIGGHNDWDELEIHDWMDSERKEVCDSQGWPIYKEGVCFNSGVVVCSQHHKLWERPKHPLPEQHHCAEQFCVEQQLFKNKYKWTQIPTKFNVQWWMPRYQKLLPTAEIVHLANSLNKMHDLKMAMQDYFFNHKDYNVTSHNK